MTTTDILLVSGAVVSALSAVMLFVAVSRIRSLREEIDVTEKDNRRLRFLVDRHAIVPPYRDPPPRCPTCGRALPAPRAAP